MPLFLINTQFTYSENVFRKISFINFSLLNYFKNKNTDEPRFYRQIFRERKHPMKHCHWWQYLRHYIGVPACFTYFYRTSAAEWAPDTHWPEGLVGARAHLMGINIDSSGLQPLPCEQPALKDKNYKTNSKEIFRCDRCPLFIFVELTDTRGNHC